MDTNPSVSPVSGNIVTNNKQLQKKIRKRRNNIPFPTPHNPDFKKWISTYSDQLEDMYKITASIVRNKYPKIDWGSPTIRNFFANIIYNNSSKYISKYI